MKNLKFVLSIFLFVFVVSQIDAQKYSNEFLNIGAGAQSNGMGHAITAITGNAFSAYWNPAGMLSLDSKEGMILGAQHTEWFAGIGKYDYLSMVIPSTTKKTAFGFSIVRFGIDDIPNTLSLYDSEGNINYDNVVPFSAVDYAIFFSYARMKKIKNTDIKFGGNLKIIPRQIGSFAKSWGFGIDLGAQMNKGKWSFGLMAKDITTTFNAWKFSFTDEEAEILKLENNEVPINSTEITKPQIILGVAYNTSIKKIGITTSFDFQMTTDGKRNYLISGNPISINPVFGIQLDYQKKVFFRTGINNIQEEVDFDGKFWTLQPNIGVGLNFKNINIDYAFTDLGAGDGGTYSHVVSLTYQLKPKKH